MRLHRFLFFLLLVFLPTQLGLHFWPSWALVLGRRVDYLSPTLYLTDILILLTLVSWLFENIRNVKREIFKKVNINWKLLTIAGLFILFNLKVAVNKPEVIYMWIKFVEFGLLGLYIVKTKPGLSLIASGLAVGVVYSSFLSISQFFLQRSVGGLLWWLGERTFNVSTPGIARINFCQPFSQNCSLLLRPYATFPHPNVLSGFLAVTLPLIIIQLSNTQIIKLSNQKKIFYLSSVILGVNALILSFSRSGIAAGAMGIIISSLITIRSKIFKTLLILCGFILIIITIFQFRNVTLNDESIVVREQLNTAAVKLWSQSPILGIGLGNFLVDLPNVLPFRTVYFLQPVHNIYLLILTEAGITGLAVFIWLIVKIIGNFLNLLKNSKNNQSSDKIIVYFCLYLFLAVGLVDHYPLDLQQGQLLFTLFLALALTP